MWDAVIIWLVPRIRKLVYVCKEFSCADIMCKSYKIIFTGGFVHRLNYFWNQRLTWPYLSLVSFHMPTLKALRLLLIQPINTSQAEWLNVPVFLYAGKKAHCQLVCINTVSEVICNSQKAGICQVLLYVCLPTKISNWVFKTKSSKTWNTSI